MSEASTSGALILCLLGFSRENFSPPYAKENGHDFMMHTFPLAEECSHCNKFLAGCFYQGYLCTITKLKAHKQCIEKLVMKGCKYRYSCPHFDVSVLLI